MKKLFLFFFSSVLVATEYQFPKTPCTRMAHMLAAADAVAAMPLMKQSLISASGQRSVYLTADAMRRSYEELCVSESDSGAVVYNLDRYVLSHMSPAAVKNEYKKSEGFYRKARAEGSLKAIYNADPITITIIPSDEVHARALAGAAARIVKERSGGVTHDGVEVPSGECFLERAYYHMLNEDFKTLSDAELQEKLAELVAKR